MQPRPSRCRGLVRGLEALVEICLFYPIFGTRRVLASAVMVRLSLLLCSLSRTHAVLITNRV